MARITTEQIILDFSKLEKSTSESSASIVQEQWLSILEEVAQELAGTGVIVEANRGTDAN